MIRRLRSGHWLLFALALALTLTLAFAGEQQLLLRWLLCLLPCVRACVRA